MQLARAWMWAADELRWLLSGDAERWLPLRLSLHVLMMVGLAGLTAVLLWDFFAARFPSPLPPELKVDVVRLVMYVIAGLGGVVALVIAYRRQRLGEAAAVLAQAADSREQTKAFSERFAAAAEQLSSDKAANRLAGVYAMAELADDWDQGRQTCINVLCAYMRVPYDPPEETPDLETRDARNDHQERRAQRQVRRTVMDVIGERLRADPVQGTTWHDHDFDLSDAVLDTGNLQRIKITGGRVDFSGAVFSGGQVDFSGAVFSGGQVDFSKAEFSGGQVDFSEAEFSGSQVDFSGAEFSSGRVNFFAARLSGGQVGFGRAVFSGGRVDFVMAGFFGSQVSFNAARLSSGQVGFGRAVFSGGRVSFSRAEFSGGRVDFSGAKFSGSQVDFRDPKTWMTPPVFDTFREERPAGLLLPDLESSQSLDAPATDE